MLSKKEIINNELELLEDPASKWFYNDLKLLVNLDNHRYTFDGYEYVWESNVLGEWNRHCVNNFSTLGKLKHYRMFNIKHWTKDLEKLNRIKANEDRNAAKVLEKIVDREFKAVIKISKKKLKPIKKVQLILEVKSELDNATICKALGLSKRTFYRYIDKINKIN
tara:strand:+ start:517 stop:1011 length:495 start_codon:yes stop_codon:yes gene_type:complete